MKSKFFLAVLLLTPILVVTFSTLYFLMGMSPEGTKNNGVFFIRIELSNHEVSL